MSRAYIDTNVFLYAIGTEHRYRDPCRRIIQALGQRTLVGETSVETLQEIVHHRRRGDRAAPERARRAAALCDRLHPVDHEIAFLALDLAERTHDLPPRDAVHAATVLARGSGLVVSADHNFDLVSDLERVDPLDRRSMARLLGD